MNSARCNRSRSQASSPPWPTMTKSFLDSFPGFGRVPARSGPAARCFFRRKAGRRSRGSAAGSSRIARAFRGMEEFGVDAARHQETGPTGVALKKRAQFGVGGEEHLCLAVKPGRSRQSQVFNLLAGGRGMALGQQAQEPDGAPSPRTRARWCASLRPAANSGGAPGPHPADPLRWGR